MDDKRVRNTRRKGSPNRKPQGGATRNRREPSSSRTDRGALLSRDNLSSDMRRNIFRGQVLEGGKGSQKVDYRHRLLRDKRIFIIPLILLIVFLASSKINSIREYHAYDVKWQTAQKTMNSNYEVFADGILSYNKDGSSLLDANGAVIWQKAYTMNMPMLSICDGYAVIYDKEGTNFYTYDKDGCIGEGKANRPILKAVIASQGVVATVQEENTGGYNYIQYYNKDGSALDIELRTTIADSGYPLDIDISSNGTQLIASYVYMDAGTVSNRITFYNFDVGKSEPQRMVGTFSDYDQILVPQVAFLGDEMAVTFGDGRIDFYTLENALKPERKESYSFDNKTVKSIFYNDDYAGVILDTGSTSHELRLYDNSGKEVLKKEINFEYEKVKLTGENIVFLNDTSCQIYTLTGTLKYEGGFELDSVLKDVVSVSGKEYLVSTNNLAEVVRFK